jgi:DNA-binding transcriptional regulator LsrR (DeoR family)
VGPNGNVQATILTQQLAEHLGCPAWLLPSQSIEHSVEERARLVNSPDVAAVVAKFAEVDVAIVGIGELEPSQLLKNSGNYYNEDMLHLLSERGAVGDICLHYYDASGKPVLTQGGSGDWHGAGANSRLPAGYRAGGRAGKAQCHSRRVAGELY